MFRRLLVRAMRTLPPLVLGLLASVPPAAGHDVAFGHILRQNGQVIQHAFMGHAYGSIHVPIQAPSDQIDITFLDADSLEVTFGNPYTLRWVVIDTTVVQFQQVDDWSFVLTGGPAAGSTQLFLRIWEVDHAGYTSPGNPVIVENLIGIADGGVPERQALLQPPAPNPSRADILLKYELGVPGQVDLRIFDVTGRLVDILVHGQTAPGMHTARWDASQQPAGVYFVELATPGHVERRKVVRVE